MNAHRNIFVYVFIPYSLCDGQPESPDYDTPTTRAELAQAFSELSVPWKWQPITFENLSRVIETIVASDDHARAVVLNFCDGDEVNGSPGISVVKRLESAKIAFTGADAYYYHTTTSKTLMKQHFDRAQVATAAYAIITDPGQDIPGLCARLGTPLIVKPAISAASHGITLKSIVYTDKEIYAQTEELVHGRHSCIFPQGTIFAERFIAGPEFTVLIVGSSKQTDELNVYHPVERVFSESLPLYERFLSYERYWGLYQQESPLPSGEALYHYRLVKDDVLKERIIALARRAYLSVGGCGYGRVDIRMDIGSHELFVLEVNSNCGISSDDQTSVGQILRLSGSSYPHLLSNILNDALARQAWVTGKSS
jgi:D-alanine-D-alanine ligase